jgi:predicted MFS family arabinose efflux permease
VLRSTFSALRERDFAVFFSGQVVSLTGTWMERAALAAVVYEISGHDEAWLAWVGAIPAVPVVLVSIAAGAIADRLPLLRVVVATQLLMMTCAVAMTLLVASGEVRPWHVAAYAFVASGLFAIDAPARQALVPRLVRRENLTNAIALGAVSFNAARLVGGVAFWAVMTGTTWGEAGCLALNAASFGAVLTGILLIRTHPPVISPNGGAGRGLAEGLRCAGRTPAIRGALLVVLASSLLGFQVSHLLPVYAEKVWDTGKASLGTLHGWLGAGALAGGLLLATRSASVHRGRLILLCGVAAAVLLAALAFVPSFEVGCALLAAAGFCLIQTHSASNAVIQSAVPDDLRGRVMSLFTLAVLGAFPLGGLAAGHVAKAIGAPLTTLLASVLLVASLAAIHATHRDLARSA